MFIQQDDFAKPGHSKILRLSRSSADLSVHNFFSHFYAVTTRDYVSSSHPHSLYTIRFRVRVWRTYNKLLSYTANIYLFFQRCFPVLNWITVVQDRTKILNINGYETQEDL